MERVIEICLAKQIFVISLSIRVSSLDRYIARKESYLKEIENDITWCMFEYSFHLRLLHPVENVCTYAHVYVILTFRLASYILRKIFRYNLLFGKDYFFLAFQAQIFLVNLC